MFFCFTCMFFLSLTDEQEIVNPSHFDVHTSRKALLIDKTSLTRRRPDGGETICPGSCGHADQWIRLGFPVNGL